MNETRSFASLEPTLLARKGGAKPAMRPQVGLNHALALSPIDDLGWNDMGEADEDAHEHDTQAGPAAANGKAHKAGTLKGQPEVRRQIQAIADHLAKRDDKPAPKQETPARESALESGRRAAFTLRLDAQRHLKLRLACTMKNRSAQQIVTEALDRLLSGMPEIDSLAAQLKQR